MLLGNTRLGFTQRLSKGTQSNGPGNVTGVTNWYDFTDGTVNTRDGSNKVSQFNDKSGNGRHLTASTTARPTFVDISASPVPATVPNVAGLYAQCAEWVAYISTRMNADGLTSDPSLVNRYYDGEAVRYHLATYFSDTAYYTQADECNTSYHNYGATASWGLPGYEVFPEGLAERWLTRSTAQGKTDLIALQASAAFNGTGTTGYYTIEGNYANVAVDGHNLSREWSYAAYTLMQLQRVQTLSAPQLAKLAFIMTDMYRFKTWWLSTASYVRPFMVGIWAKTMIFYYENVSADAAIITAVKAMLDYCIGACWIEGKKSFYYTDRDGTGQSWSAGSLDRDASGTPELNMLLAPAFAWMWKVSGQQTYRSYFDKLWAGTIPVYSGGFWSSGAYWGTQSSSNPSGKQFDQCFFWGDNGIAWAQATAGISSGVYKTTFDGTANGMSATNGATAQPSTTIVVATTTGDTSAQRDFYDTAGHEIGRYNTAGKIEFNAGTSLAFTETRGSKEMFTFINNGNSSYIRKNTGAYTMGAAGANAPGATLYIGKDSAGSAFFAGDMYEFVRYNKVLSAGELATVEGSLMTKYGLTPFTYTPPAAFDAATYGTVNYWADFTTAANVLKSGGTQAADADHIDTINDRSSNAFNLQQTTDAGRATCKTNIVNSLQIARGAGAARYAFSQAQGGTITKNLTGLTLAAVFNSSSLAANQTIFSIYGSAAARVEAFLLNTTGALVITGTPQDGGTSSQQFWASGISTGSWYVLAVEWDWVNKTMKAWVNNVSKGTVTVAGWSGGNSSNTNPGAADANVIMGGFYGTVGVVGDLGEVVTWNAALGATTIGTMSTALGAKYGLTI